MVPALVPAMANAQADLQGSLCGGTDLQATGSTCPTSASADTTVNNTITLVINTFSIIVGFISVVMLIYGGFKYITSSGDSGKVTSAKNTILYALIGLVIVFLAQIIVKFVIGKTNQVVQP